jgi:hypothetical protein
MILANWMPDQARHDASGIQQPMKLDFPEESLNLGLDKNYGSATGISSSLTHSLK